MAPLVAAKPRRALPKTDAMHQHGRTIFLVRGDFFKATLFPEKYEKDKRLATHSCDSAI